MKREIHSTDDRVKSFTAHNNGKHRYIRDTTYAKHRGFEGRDSTQKIVVSGRHFPVLPPGLETFGTTKELSSVKCLLQ